MISVAVSMTVLMLIASVVFHRHFVDPDGFIGPSYLRLPTILGLAFMVDLLPRTLWDSRLNPRRMPTVFRERVRLHWTRERLALMVSGLLCFYFTYVSYRNLKSAVPSVEGQSHKFDFELHMVDKAFFFGHEPATVLHNLLGSGISAEVLSTVYLWFLPLVPLALTAWLIWSRNLGFGYWFASSQVIAWTLGTISYFALPTLGPGFRYPWLYKTVDDTAAGRLMQSLSNSRIHFLHGTPLSDPVATSLQSVAGFASLHCAITLLVAMMIQYTVQNNVLRIVFWVNFCLTCVATLYFGWHYVADDIAGIAIALVSFYVGGWASHQDFRRHRPVKEHGVEPAAKRITTV
jgi:PAP2 superfamily